MIKGLGGPIASSGDDVSEEDAPAYKRHMTRSDEEPGEEQIPSDDEPDDGITDAMLAQDDGGALQLVVGISPQVYCLGVP